MAQVNKENVFKPGIEVLTVKEYCEKYGDGIQPQSVYYAIDNDMVDYLQIGRERYVVMTEHTKQYTPNASPKRKSKISL